MRHLILIVCVVCALLWPDSGEAGDGWTWGVAAGSPQVLAVTLEQRVDSPVRVQGHAGTILLMSSVGLRALLLSSREGIAPYAFLGAGILHIAEGDGGGAIGSTGHGWGGVGARFPTGPLTWFGELGVLWGLNTDKGYESALPALALGVGFGRP